LAQKERVDALEVIKDKAASELGVAGSQVEELESQIQRLRSRAETLQRRIDTLPSTSALREEALSELPGIPARIASLEAQQSAAQAEFNRLRPISLKAFSDHAEAVRALSVMA
jgi:chromosome segregation ATPase